MRLCCNKYFDRDGETRVLISVRDIIPKLTREKHNRKWNKMDGRISIEGWKFYSCAYVLTAGLVERDGLARRGARNNRGNVSTYSMC